MKFGLFNDVDSINDRATLEPHDWWAVHGTCAPMLQSVALKLLMQPSSSSCAERNWSTYSFVHSLRRNKITPQRAQDLVFVHSNLRLLSRRSPQYAQGETRMWDIGEDSFDSFEDVGVLEVASLSLDEPDLEAVVFTDDVDDDIGDEATDIFLAGIGFKSVFLVSAQPYIFSNGYQVRFNEEPNQDCGIGYIVPEWVDRKPTVSEIQSVYGSQKILTKTTIILPLRSEKVEAVKKQLSEVHPELLLFLCKIKQLSVSENSKGSHVSTVSAISISSETNFIARKDKNADSRILHLSSQERNEVNKCRYYIWRQTLPVKPGYMVSGRKEAEEWLISLAFPLEERMKRTTFSGVYAFLPTAMVTSFPFIIHADFILASSRETIMLDCKWNLGILDCVPCAFMNAFVALVESVRADPLSVTRMFDFLPVEASSFVELKNVRADPFSVARMFQFFPVEVSSFVELNNVRNSIGTMVLSMDVVPYESFSDGVPVFCRPTEAVRLLPDFRRLLSQAKEQGVALDCISSTGKFVLHSSLDLQEYQKVLDFLHVGTDCNYSWYAKCIQDCNLVLHASDNVYMDLLYFCTTMRKFIMNIPLLKYIDREGEVAVCSVASMENNSIKICYALDAQHHTWLIKWNKEFMCLDNLFFMPDSTQIALASYDRRLSLCNSLLLKGRVVSVTVCVYIHSVVGFIKKKYQTQPVVLLGHFLYHSHLNNFITESEVYSICKFMPIIDDHGHIYTERSKTLVPASESKWAKLMGYNPFSKEKYIEMADRYFERCIFAGECTPKKVLSNFLIKYTKALDLPELHPPDVDLPVASSQLSTEQAFLLLDWIRGFRTKGIDMPARFIQSIRAGKWMKTCSGFKSPIQCFLSDVKVKFIYSQMGDVLQGYSFVDEEYYQNKIRLYADVLEFIGVRCGSEDTFKLIIDHLKTLASSRLTKEHAISLMKFIRYSVYINKLDDDLLKTLQEGNWLKTSQGFTSPTRSIFLASEEKSVLQITKLHVLDEAFYGGNIGEYTSELKLLGVVMDMEQACKLIAESFAFPSDPSTISRDSVLLILKCIRNLGSSDTRLSGKIRDQPWLKTSLGFRSPSKSILKDSNFNFLLNVVRVPLIDESFYGDGIRSFVDELKAIGVGVGLESSSKIVAAQFKSLALSFSLSRNNVLSLLRCINQMNGTIPSALLEFKNSLSGVKWLRTRRGYKSSPDSVLFDSKWGTVSHFVDLPLIDDAFYGISIYTCREELKMMGVVVDFMEGSQFVARGLNLPKDSGVITVKGVLSLLKCVGFLLEKSAEKSLPEDFLKKMREGKWLKTYRCYRSPEQCLLFDSNWLSVLKPEDGPFIDDKFYNGKISMYQDQLKSIGVKVDLAEVWMHFSSTLVAYTNPHVIRRIYKFLRTFMFTSNLQYKRTSMVWIPNQDWTAGEWMSCQVCVIHDKDDLFSSQLQVLDKFYEKELLPLFSLGFGVAITPSIDDYVQLWNHWELNVQHQVTSAECCSFWTYILEKWDSNTEEMLRRKITKLPASVGPGKEIQLVKSGEIFLPDDLRLKKLLTGASENPLFVWQPQYCSPSIPLSKLYEIYSKLGVQKVSKSLQFGATSSTLGHKFEKVEDPREWLIGKGLIEIVLGFLSCHQIHMPAKERQAAAKALVDLEVYETDEPIIINCSILLPSAGKELNLQTRRMVLWDKDSCRLLIHKCSGENKKTSIEFAASFAQAISEGLLQGNMDMVNGLCKIIQMGFAFGFQDDAVEFLLLAENLQLYMEDIEFLCTTFPSEVPSEEQSYTSRKRKSLSNIFKQSKLRTKVHK
ncbi:uncharacterized protein LOC143890988 [Tasmannia lanceolata]|uniref:uncharacterized protein LOC143890988 n=1 Tax=Tasmannia lanceolata TaxID=3420 RepID=UPI004064166F